MNKKPRIALITTGGTIAMAAPDHNSGGVFQYTSQHLLAAIPQISEIAEIEAIDLFSKASSNLTLQDLNTLYTQITKMASSVDGIVITHGTDVLEETAFALSLLSDIQIPVVITGAMRRADLPGADGPANLLNAVQVAVSGNAKNCGVLVVMNGEILPGFFTKKQHSFLPQAFSNYPIGWVAEDRVRIFLKPDIQKPIVKIGPNRAKILTLEYGFDTASEDLECIDFSKLDAFILNVTGVGHVSADIAPKLEQITKTIPVIFTSRTGDGETFRNYYGSPGAESDLLAKGLIAGGFLNSRQVRMLLLIAFSEQNLTREPIRALLAHFN